MPKKNSLINRSAVREKSLALLAQNRPHLADKFTRVSEDYFVRIEGYLVYAIAKYLEVMPTSGKTLR